MTDCIYVYIYIYACASCICLCLYICIFMYIIYIAYMYIYIYIFIYIFIYTHMHIRTYIHTWFAEVICFDSSICACMYVFVQSCVCKHSQGQILRLCWNGYAMCPIQYEVFHHHVVHPYICTHIYKHIPMHVYIFF
jgi:hypothetical protein